jgi:hypothetical protein
MLATSPEQLLQAILEAKAINMERLAYISTAATFSPAWFR